MKTLTPALFPFPKVRGRNYPGRFFNDEMMAPGCDRIQFSLSSEERVEVRPSVASTRKASASDRFHRKGSKRSK
jgi:hypothetical protein